MSNSTATQPRYRLGVDVGGTHTDLVLLDSVTGQLMVEKIRPTVTDADVVCGCLNPDYFFGGLRMADAVMLEKKVACTWIRLPSRSFATRSPA